jgi:hypothetical protein
MSQDQEVAPILADGIETLIEEPFPEDTPEPSTGESEPSLPIHHFAASFPMLEGEELDQLVDDIRENGLRNPIVLNSIGQIIDGRNRFKACLYADVKPTFITIESDPIAYILSANVTRRHLLKSQCAMAYAMAYPEATAKGGRGKTTVLNTGVSSEYVTKARFVLRHAPDLAAKVMAGSSLQDAYALTAEQKNQQEEYERLRHEVGEHLDSIIGICARLKSASEKPEKSFLDQGDFLRQVRSEVEQVNDFTKQLMETI